MTTPHTPGFIHCGTGMRYSLLVREKGGSLSGIQPGMRLPSMLGVRVGDVGSNDMWDIVPSQRFSTCQRQYHQKRASSVAFVRQMLKSCANDAEAKDGPPVVDRQFIAVGRMSVRVRLCQRPRIQRVIFVLIRKDFLFDQQNV